MVDDEPQVPLQHTTGSPSIWADTPGIVSLIFGCLGILCLLLAFPTCGFTLWLAAAIGLAGSAVAFWGRGKLRVASLSLNLLSVVVAVGLLVFFLGGFAEEFIRTRWKLPPTGARNPLKPSPATAPTLPAKPPPKPPPWKG